MQRNLYIGTGFNTLGGQTTGLDFKLTLIQREKAVGKHPNSHFPSGMREREKRPFRRHLTSSITTSTHPWLVFAFLHVRRSGGTSDNFDKLVGNDGLASSVVKDLVLANHLTGVLGGVLWDNC